MLELTVKNYASRTGVSEQAVRKQIKNNKLRTCKKSLDGRITTLIQVEEVERQETTLTQPVEQNIPLHMDYLVQSQKQYQGVELIEFMREVKQDIAKYAELAGQSKLLMDSEHQTKQEYFKLVQENAQLKAKLELFEEQNKRSFMYLLRKL